MRWFIPKSTASYLHSSMTWEEFNRLRVGAEVLE